MNKEQLKELVKAHFNLVEYKDEKFGEVYDENKAFKIIFPGDELKVGDEVKVMTEEGQESLAPNGYHRLEDGRTIKTEGSTVTEIENSEEMAEEGDARTDAEEEGYLDGIKDEKEDLKDKFGADPAISQVEGTSPQNATTDTDPNPEAPIETVAEVEARMMASMDEKIAPLLEEMKAMKSKFEEFSAAPATEKVTINSNTKSEKFATESLQSKQMKVMSELLKTKK